jgi:hypothetical protein
MKHAVGDRTPHALQAVEQFAVVILLVAKKQDRENDQRSHENPHRISPSPSARSRGRWLHAGELSPDKDARAIGADRFIVQFALIDGKDLPGAVSNGIAFLRDEKRARDDETPDREKMSVPALAGTRSQLLQFYFLVSVGSELRFEFALVHCDLLQLLALFSPISTRRPMALEDHRLTRPNAG